MHVEPPQHAWPTPPQPAQLPFAWQMSPEPQLCPGDTQTKAFESQQPLEHSVPLVQHGPPTSPQVTQVFVVGLQARLDVLHPPAAMHGCPGPPVG